MNEEEFVRKIKTANGKVYAVGGFVRDTLRGKTPKDKDYCVAHTTEEKFCELFPQAVKVGNSFPVYLVKINGKMCEVAFARTEKKNGSGYRGFVAQYDPAVTIETDLQRRDTTMNAMAMELPGGNVIDPFGGRKDIAAKRIRAVGQHFTEDPVRALRAARQAAEFGFSVDDSTYGFMAACAKEIRREPTERLCGELVRALSTDVPSRFFRVLKRGNVLRETYPEIFALIGKTQPLDFHPEGDAFNHTMLVVDKVATETADVAARFAALAHDIGKGRTPLDMLPHHYGHERVGLEVLAEWNRRMTIPKNLLKAARLVIAEHMRAPRLAKPHKIVELMLKISASVIGFSGFNAVIRADNGSLPNYLANYGSIMPALAAIDGVDAPPELTGKEIGQWILHKRIQAYLCIASA